MEHRVLVIGLGSMGKRRLRNLKALGYKNIFGFDLRVDRRDEVTADYQIPVFSLFEDALSVKPTVFIISVPPDKHHIYMEEAVKYSIPFFVEASVVDTGIKEIIKETANKKITAAPSATMCFHPAIQKLFSIVESGELGDISNFIYHSGQYLPDWHTYEKVSDFYVSQKSTGGAREIVPFELTWITKLLGFPSKVAGIHKKTIMIEGADQIDDSYNFLLDYPKFTVNMTIDVVSRAATRKLLINGSKKQLTWNWDDNNIKIFSPEKNTWETFEYETAPAMSGYNKNITEQMYVDEVRQFFSAVDGKEAFSNTLEFDLKVLNLLYSIEESYAAESFIKI
ncbi:MAG: gfo/Idh/MocA family oxidoreductase [Bacteroidetes bacterium]|nr:gfo/Idh/MocA family oxidoreductase [Bacteroidota bacterium]